MFVRRVHVPSPRLRTARLLEPATGHTAMGTHAPEAIMFLWPNNSSPTLHITRPGCGSIPNSQAAGTIVVLHFRSRRQVPLTVTQTGNKVESVDNNGKGYAGFVSGSTYTMVTYYSPDGRTESQIITITLDSGGTTGSGSCRWFSRGGPDTLCGGGFPLLAQRAWTIMATAGSGGTISPSGSIVVPNNWNQLITITPDKGYRIKDVRVDGVSVGAIETYTFSNVQAAHTIEAFFRKRGGLPFLGLFDD